MYFIEYLLGKYYSSLNLALYTCVEVNEKKYLSFYANTTIDTVAISDLQIDGVIVDLCLISLQMSCPGALAPA